MKLYKGNKGNVDFSEPIKLSELEKERLINFLENNFYEVIPKEVKQFRSNNNRLGDSNFTKKWSDNELELLLKIDETNQSIARQLGRSWMSVEMKRLDLIPKMLDFAAKKGVDIYKVDIKQLVKDFLKEHKDEILIKKRQKKEIKRKEEELKHIEEKKKISEFLKNLGINK